MKESESEVLCTDSTALITITHGISRVKKITAQKAIETKNFKNTKQKLLRNNAAICFNLLKPSGNFTYHQV
jgi:predicted methyltransferase